MARRIEADLCIIGAGSAGLSVAAGASQMGARTVLVESDEMGGDCLNRGCVPSKALIVAARAAFEVAGAGRFGIASNGGKPSIDFSQVRRHIQKAIDAIAPHDSQERFERLGVTVIRANAQFVGPQEAEAAGTLIRARRFVVATGSRPRIPKNLGLAAVPYLTNETIFTVDELPAHLLVLGAGPAGVELAQAYCRLGASVSLVDQVELLPRDDPELAAMVRASLLADGVDLFERACVRQVEKSERGIAMLLDKNGCRQRLEGSHLLIAAGRAPAIDGLGLAAAGVIHDANGIMVDRRLRTANRQIYALGDVIDGPRFTHAANYQARIVLQNTLFRIPARVNYRALPWATYCDPELAHVGLAEGAAQEAGHRPTILRSPFKDNDRAQIEGRIQGLVKVVVGRRGRILGASIVGPHAGDLILPWALAIERQLGIKAMAGLTAPYPVWSEAGKRAAGTYFTPSLFSAGTRRLVRFLAWLG